MSSVLVTVDALRADHLSQYGYERETLPALDRLLDDGTLFESAYANGPHTARSIPSFLTSRYDPAEPLIEGPTVATAISGGDVTTGGFHSNTAISTRYDAVQGFDYYEDFTEDMDEGSADTLTKAPHYRAYEALVDYGRPVLRNIPGVKQVAKRAHRALSPPESVHSFTVYVGAAELTDAVIDWLDDHADEEFFLWVHYMDPHRPYGLHPDPPAFADERPDRDRLKELMVTASQDNESLTERERELIVDLYDSDVRYVSTHLDRLFDAMQARGIWADATVAFTADHGEEFWEHGCSFHRNRPYEELVHVPLVVKPPADDDRPATVEGTRELVDVAPTFCRAHGVEPPDAFVGTDLYEGDQRDAVSVGAIRHDDRAVAVRSEGWTYVWSQREEDERVEELYDRADDPAESTSVADDHPDQIERLRSLIPETVQASELSFEFTAESEEMRDRLESLGYLE